jgi:hypothetical protein
VIRMARPPQNRRPDQLLSADATRKTGPMPLQRPAPDTEGDTHPMQVPRHAPVPTDIVIRDRRGALEICLLCGLEHEHGRRHENSCPECDRELSRPRALGSDEQETNR